MGKFYMAAPTTSSIESKYTKKKKNAKNISHKKLEAFCVVSVLVEPLPYPVPPQNVRIKQNIFENIRRRRRPSASLRISWAFMFTPFEITSTPSTFIRLYTTGGGWGHALHVCSNFYIRKYVYYHRNYNPSEVNSILGIAYTRFSSVWYFVWL